MTKRTAIATKARTARAKGAKRSRKAEPVEATDSGLAEVEVESSEVGGDGEPPEEEAPRAPSTPTEFLKRAIDEHGEDPSESDRVSRFVTESPALNRIAGIGGIPLGRVVLVWGPYRGGKSTLTARVLGDVARAGGVGYYVDVERAAVKSWFRSCGLDDDQYVYTRPRTQEDVQDRVLAFLRMVAKAKAEGEIPWGLPVVVAVDTVTKLVPSDMLDGKIGSRNYGLQANLLNDWTKASIVLAEEANACLWLISQERRDREGIWTGGNLWPGIPPWMAYRPTSGDDLLFSASLGLRVAAHKSVKETIAGEETKVGREHEIRVLKSKFGPDMQAAGIARWFSSNGLGWAPKGIDVVREIVAEALDAGVLAKVVGKARIESPWGDGWPGEAKLRSALVEDPDLRARVCSALQERADALARRNGHEFDHASTAPPR